MIQLVKRKKKRARNLRQDVIHRRNSICRNIFDLHLMSHAEPSPAQLQTPHNPSEGILDLCVADQKTVTACYWAATQPRPRRPSQDKTLLDPLVVRSRCRVCRVASCSSSSSQTLSAPPPDQTKCSIRPPSRRRPPR